MNTVINKKKFYSKLHNLPLAIISVKIHFFSILQYYIFVRSVDH